MIYRSELIGAIVTNGQAMCSRTCPFCGEDNGVVVTEEQWERLKAAPPKANIQDTLPELDADTREFFATGIHPACWNETFEGREE
jgi:hypothetical protein